LQTLTLFASVFGENVTLFASTGIDTISGFENLQGSACADMLRGDSGANVIEGRAGNDKLYGGGGADTFKFTGSLGSVDQVMDFSVAQGDKIDIKGLLIGYDPLTKAITDFVEFTTSGTNTIVKVDVDGTGSGATWQQIAVLNNVTGLTDEAALKASGNLVV
jgi:Ca2+-binding RTX toxin-like protein